MQGIQVIIDRIEIYPSLLAFEIISYVFGCKPIADIVKYKPHNAFQQFHIPDTVSLDRIAQDNGGVDVIDQFVDSFV